MSWEIEYDGESGDAMAIYDECGLAVAYAPFDREQVEAIVNAHNLTAPAPPKEEPPTPPPGHKLDGKRLPKAGVLYYGRDGQWYRPGCDWGKMGPSARWIAVPDPHRDDVWVTSHGPPGIIRKCGGRDGMAWQVEPLFGAQGALVETWGIGDFDHIATEAEVAAAYATFRRRGNEQVAKEADCG